MLYKLTLTPKLSDTGKRKGINSVCVLICRIYWIDEDKFKRCISVRLSSLDFVLAEKFDIGN